MLVALHILNELRPSGMERMLQSSSPYWAREGWRIILVGTGPQHTFAEELRTAGYEVVLLPRIKSLKGFMRLAFLMGRVKPDILHNHSESCHGFISVLSRCILPWTPIVRTVHNCFKFSGSVKIRRLFQHRLESICGVFRVSCSTDVQLNEEENWHVSSRVIENWIDTAKVRDFVSQNVPVKSADSLRVCLVGNCSPVKDHKFALQVLEEFEQIEILHVGENAGMDDDERKILKSMDSCGRLMHNGPTDKIFQLFRDSDLHIICSTNEGAPVVVIESVVLGIETWVRDVPGLRWAFDLPGVSVFKNQIELRQMLVNKLNFDFNHKSNPELRLRELERFSANRGVIEYAQIYLHLLK